MSLNSIGSPFLTFVGSGIETQNLYYTTFFNEVDAEKRKVLLADLNNQGKKSSFASFQASILTFLNDHSKIAKCVMVVTTVSGRALQSFGGILALSALSTAVALHPLALLAGRVIYLIPTITKIGTQFTGKLASIDKKCSSLLRIAITVNIIVIAIWHSMALLGLSFLAATTFYEKFATANVPQIKKELEDRYEVKKIEQNFDAKVADKNSLFTLLGLEELLEKIHSLKTDKSDEKRDLYNKVNLYYIDGLYQYIRFTKQDSIYDYVSGIEKLCRAMKSAYEHKYGSVESRKDVCRMFQDKSDEITEFFTEEKIQKDRKDHLEGKLSLVDAFIKDNTPAPTPPPQPAPAPKTRLQSFIALFSRAENAPQPAVQNEEVRPLQVDDVMQTFDNINKAMRLSDLFDRSLLSRAMRIKLVKLDYMSRKAEDPDQTLLLGLAKQKTYFEREPSPSIKALTVDLFPKLGEPVEEELNKINDMIDSVAKILNIDLKNSQIDKEMADLIAEAEKQAKKSTT